MCSALLLGAFSFSACSSDDQQGAWLATPLDEESLADLPIGLLDEPKADQGWDHATTCKAIPELEQLVDPMITISLDGLTLHLEDRAGDYDRVFPIGPGAIEDGESLTPVSTGLPEGVFWARLDERAVQDGPRAGERGWGWNESCRIWWRSGSGSWLPVFAGMPFIRLEGPPVAAYGIHGPIDQYTREDGGKLRRGYVSHGCIRMESADLLEVYARIRGTRTPVRVQRAIERRDDDSAVDVENRWLLSECRTDDDCPFDGGVCRFNPWSSAGFCTLPCERYCPDRAGFPTTFCVADPEDPSAGVCTYRPDPVQNGCRRYPGFVERADVPRVSQPWVERDACMPGSEGWVGDSCLSDADCGLTETCLPSADGGGAGVCTEPCARYCPDLDSHAGTFCVAAPEHADVSGGVCLARCSSNDDCPRGTTCEDEPRHSMTSVVRSVCLPY